VQKQHETHPAIVGGAPCGALSIAPAGTEDPTVGRIERALVVLAYLIEVEGDIHVPLYEKFEAELDALTRQAVTKDRARKRLQAYVDAAGRSTIL
jgi:hypothetical protein